MFDYIIVGAGSAGCILADRLSADSTVSVLLLEAGGPDSRREVHIPVAFPRLLKTDCDWAFETEEQRMLNDRRLYWPRGKMLGGSGSMNGMIYVRGNRLDYDSWRACGNAEWAYADVLPYFKKAEHHVGGEHIYYGKEGPLYVDNLRYVNPLTTLFLEAATQAGVRPNADFNGEHQEGVGLHQVNQKDGQRHSTAAAYLKPVLSRSNLTVKTHAHVTRIAFDGQCASGVNYLYQDRMTHEPVSREVILCGGAVNSPQLLMLSGIGPADHLRNVDIPVIADLPGVGRNLQDHLQTSVIHDCTKPFSIASSESPLNLLRYLLTHSGPYTSNVGEAGLFARTSEHLDRPDLQLIFAPNYSMAHGFGNPPGDGFTLAACLLRPKSMGTLTLRSNDPFAAPVIQPNYLVEPEDLQTLIAGIKLARRIIEAPAFDSVRGAEVYPGTERQKDMQVAEFIRGNAETLYHPVGTCAMGQDPLAVVDGALRVHGVEGVRVVDASIMPSITSGNTNAPTIMIAEKGADLIRQS